MFRVKAKLMSDDANNVVLRQILYFLSSFFPFCPLYVLTTRAVLVHILSHDFSTTNAPFFRLRLLPYLPLLHPRIIKIMGTDAPGHWAR